MNVGLRTIAVGVVLIAVGCGADAPVIDETGLPETIAAAVSADVGFATTEVECPPLDDPAIAATIVCSAVVGGAVTTFSVSINTPDVGAVTVENQEALVDLTALSGDIESTLAERLDDTIVADCGAGPLRAVAFNGSFLCDVTSGAGDRNRVIVDVGDDGTAVSWTLQEEQ